MNSLDTTIKQPDAWLDRPVIAGWSFLTIERLLVTVILVLAVISRFYILGERVMSHDEINHVVPSFSLYEGRGYQHDPVTHGPMQFHLVALSYFLFGDSDFSSRIPAALFGIATIAIVLFAFRPILGRVGALVGGLLYLISPYMLFYTRYTRNEAFVALFVTLTLLALLRYLETGKRGYLYLMTAATTLHFNTKETYYIATAQLLLFVGFHFIEQVARKRWKRVGALNAFILLLLAAFILLGGAAGFLVLGDNGNTAAAASTEAVASIIKSPLSSLSPIAQIAVPVAALLGLIALGGSLYFLITGLSVAELKTIRSFDILVLQGTLALLPLTAMFATLVGLDPLNYTNTSVMALVGVIAGLLLVAATLIGVWWNANLWLRNAAIFFVMSVLLYTTFFTNGRGLATGFVGGLGHWMVQHGEFRGGQPWYYFLLIQIPMYEYLAGLGTILAIALGIRRRLWVAKPGAPFERPAGQVNQLEIVPVGVDVETLESIEDEPVSIEGNINREIEVASPSLGVEPEKQPVPTLALLLFWGFTSLVAFSYAGEKMSWLTVHITLPMLLATAWGLGYLIEHTDWQVIRRQKWVLLVGVMGLFIASLLGLSRTLMGTVKPFSGKELEALSATANFFGSGLLLVGSAAGLVRLLVSWKLVDVVRLFTLLVFSLTGVMTARAAIRSSYINYDYAVEYLVYAHAAPGPKQVLAQIEEISQRTTGGKLIKIAYDNDVRYPYWWYLRHYTNDLDFDKTPTRDLRNYAIIVAGGGTTSKVDSIVGDDYYKFDYKRLWWPMEDYKNLTWQRIQWAISQPGMPAALLDIWLNADYKAYASITNASYLTLETWSPSDPLRMYIRKDIAAQIWNYGLAPAAMPETADPYERNRIHLEADLVVGGPDLFNAPRQMAFAPDGSMYVADSRNHRIVHLSLTGEVLGSWGAFADISAGEAPGGTFYEPWGVAVGHDGSVFVSDTWNYRIQKFTATGEFIKMWGYFGQGEAPEAMWGPRGLAIDSEGNLYAADTGNKRIIVFDPDGNFITQFGTAGFEPGQFDEPVGVAVSSDGTVYVTDVWNQRVQAFKPNPSRTVYFPQAQWDIAGWYGKSLDNKALIAVDQSGRVYVTDPEGFRVLVFDSTGKFLFTWGDFGSEEFAIGLASGVAVDKRGWVWVSDAGNMRLMRFLLPEEGE